MINILFLIAEDLKKKMKNETFELNIHRSGLKRRLRLKFCIPFVSKKDRAV